MAVLPVDVGGFKRPVRPITRSGTPLALFHIRQHIGIAPAALCPDIVVHGMAPVVDQAIDSAAVAVTLANASYRLARPLTL